MGRRSKNSVNIPWTMTKKFDLEAEKKKALKKVEAMRKGKKFKLIPHPVKGFIEVEVKEGEQ